MSRAPATSRRRANRRSATLGQHGPAPGEPAFARWTVGEVDRFLVPVHDKRAIRFLLEDLFIPHNRREWIWSSLARRGVRLAGGKRLFRRRSLLSVPGRGSDGVTATGEPLVCRAIGCLDRELRERTGTERPSFILLRDHPSSTRQGGVVFFFSECKHQPVAVAKLRWSGPSLRSEKKALDELAHKLPEELAASIPAPALYRSTGDAEVLLMPFLPGRSMDREIAGRPPGRRTIARHFVDGAVWLACFHITTRQPGKLWRVPVEVARLREAFETELAGGETVEERFWLRELEASGLELPLSAAHGDYWARNLLSQPRSRGVTRPEAPLAGVVDWERFSPAAPPLDDLFHFAVTYALNYPQTAYERAAPTSAFRHGFLEDGALSAGIRTGLTSYADLTGISLEALRLLFHLFLLRRWHEKRPIPGAGLDNGMGGAWLAFHRLLGRRESPVFQP